MLFQECEFGHLSIFFSLLSFRCLNLKQSSREIPCLSPTHQIRHDSHPIASCAFAYEVLKTSNQNGIKMKKNLALLFTLGLASSVAFAGQTGTEFQDLYDLVHDWATGYLGRAIALIFLLVGLGVGIVRGSVMGAVGCLAAAMCLLIAPSVVEGILTAVI